SIIVAPALPVVSLADVRGAPTRGKERGTLRVVFISRIARMKNLDQAIRLIAKLDGRIEFTICGPISDGAYWRECKRALEKVPPNVHANYVGEVSHDAIAAVLEGQD